jgi:hypothetical protein
MPVCLWSEAAYAKGLHPTGCIQDRQAVDSRAFCAKAGDPVGSFIPRWVERDGVCSPTSSQSGVVTRRTAANRATTDSARDRTFALENTHDDWPRGDECDEVLEGGVLAVPQVQALLLVEPDPVQRDDAQPGLLEAGQDLPPWRRRPPRRASRSTRSSRAEPWRIPGARRLAERVCLRRPRRRGASARMHTRFGAGER